jgi:hypothetical protein
MGTRRHYIRLSVAELQDLLSRPDEVADILWQMQTEAGGNGGGRDITDPPGDIRLYEIDKYWQELDVVLAQAGFSRDEANGTDRIYPLDPQREEDFSWMSELEKRAAFPPTYLAPGAVAELADRLSAQDFQAVFAAVGQEKWNEMHAGLAEYLREPTVAICNGVTEFYANAARAGDAVVSVMG